MLDNQESPSKELDDQKERDLSDKLLPCPFCGGEGVLGRTRKMWDGQKGFPKYGVGCQTNNCNGISTYCENTSKEDAIKLWNARVKTEELKECEIMLHCIEEGSAGWEEDYKNAKRQLTATQQALDSSCQTNQVLVKRLKLAKECLEVILYSGCLDGVVPVSIRKKIEITLNAIEGK